MPWKGEKMATVYLHIGLSKTGSSSIQYFLWNNRPVLEKYGICYPDLGYRSRQASEKRNGHILVVPFRGNRVNRKKEIAQYEAALDKVEELGQSYDRIVLSDEALWSSGYYNFAVWEQLKAGLEKRNMQLKLIVYLRRQDLWVQSSYAQRIRKGTIKTGESKSNATLTFYEYLEHLQNKNWPLDYYAYICELAKFFGKESLIIRVLEKGQLQGEERLLQSDFLDILGLSLSDGFEIDKEAYNQRFDNYFLEIKRVLNYLPGFQNRYNVLADYIDEIQENMPSDYKAQRKYTIFKQGDQRKFYDRFAESNRKLACEFLGRTDGRLFYDDVEDMPEFQMDADQLMNHVVLLYGNAINHLVEENKMMKEKVERLSEELDHMKQSADANKGRSFLAHLKKR